MSLLAVDSLRIDYGGGPVVEGLTFAIEPGESVGLAGESGSGKTQTALALLGLLPPGARCSGSIRFDGAELLGADEGTLNGYRATRIAMVFQDPRQALNPYLTIGEQFKRLLLEHRLCSREACRETAESLLRRVGLPDVERQYGSYPHQLSGGMRQRAMIGMALAGRPQLLVADEPTTALDVTVQAQVLGLLRELREETGIAVLLITHDLGVIAQSCERMLVMQDGSLVEQGATTAVFRRPSHPHTRAMLEATPRLDGEAPARQAGELVLEIDGVSLSYAEPGLWGPRRRSALHAVHDVSLALHRGETVAIVGESGSGKTSLARAVLGLIPAEAGTVLYLGNRLPPRLRSRTQALRRDLQMVFQDPQASLNPAMRVWDILAEPVRLHEPGLTTEGCHERVVTMLGRTGLDESLLERYPHELSGGQAQRLAIARALVLSPAVLVCDEAVAALDGTVRLEILDLLVAEQGRTGLALLFITHDLAVVRSISHRVLVMYLGRVCELADSASLFRRPKHPYARALMDAVPVPDPDAPGLRPGAAGEAASALRPPPGCVFHPRCRYAVERCRREIPRLRVLTGGSVACHRAEELDLGRFEGRAGRPQS